MKHSCKVRTGLNAHILQSHHEHTQSGPNVQYIIAAEFDNKSGPVIKHQYPKTIPGFRTHGNESTSHLASLMIPNSVENHPGKADFTVFVLYKNQNAYQLFPVTNSKSEGSGIDPSLIIEEEDSEDEQQSILRNGNVETNHSRRTEFSEPPLFFLNVVNTMLDKDNDRGAYIKAIALGTTMSNFYTFKPLLTMVLDHYMKSNTNDVTILVDCFNMINSLDLSFVTRFHSNMVLQNILSSINDDEITARIFDTKDSSLSNLLRVNELPKKDKFGNEIRFKNQILEYKFSTYRPKVLPSYFTHIPLHIDLIKHEKIKIDTKYNQLILKLLTRLIPHLTQFSDSEYSWTLIINSTVSSKDELCQFVLALSNLINGFSAEYADKSSICIFPYMEISIIDAFRENVISQMGKGKFFNVVGVSNPIFQYQVDTWDFYYDLDTDKLMKSEALSGNAGETEKSQRLRSMFSKYANSQEQANELPQQPSSKSGLMLKMIDLLVEGQHDNETVLNTLRRTSILQLLHLLNSDLDQPNTVEMVLKDQYILNYKDMIMFPDIFEYNSLKILNMIHNLELSLSRIFWPTSVQIYQVRRKALHDLYKSLKQIYKFIALNKKNLGKFLNVAMNYPLVSAFSGLDIVGINIADVDIKQLLFAERSSMKSVDSLYDKNPSAGAVDHFNTYKSFNLVFFPLLLNPQMEMDESSTLADMGPPSAFTRPSSSRHYQYHSDSSLSMISSVYETNDLISHDATYDATLHDDNNTIFTAKSNLSDLSNLVNKCRQMSIKILYRIQRHHIGKLLFNIKLNPFFRVIYQSCKSELFGSSEEKNPVSSVTSPKDLLGKESSRQIGKFRQPSPSSIKQESSMKLSVSRRDLLYDLKKLNAGNDTPLPNIDLNTHDLLESLSKLEVAGRKSNKI